ncbi:MAG TPA: WD40 repeat domain-containing protein, partial [Rugosimonospora sp.]|nr:WD40 repeat domain-containing protein [Rugosimonospora sp.]
IARSRQDAAESLNASQGDEAAQMRLALDAWQQAHTVEARGALLAAQMTNLVGHLGTGLGGVSAAVSPDGSLIAIGHADGTVWLWDTATLTRRAPPLARANGEDVVSLAFSPDGRYLAAGTFSGAGVRVWDLPSGRLRYTLLGVGAVGWLPGTATLVASRIDDGVRFPVGFWDAATGQRVRSLDTGGVPGFSLRVSADGQYLALSDGRNARVLRVRDGQVVTTLPGIANLAFAPDGSLVGGDLVGHLSQFAVPSGRLLRALTPASDPVGAAHMTVTPDGTLLAPGRAGQALGLWRLDTGTEIGFPGTSVGMAEVAASADGRLLVTTDPAAPSTVYRRATDWLDHPDAVLDVAYDPGGRRLATADVDGTVRLWDAGTRDLVTAFRPASPARGVVYSPDGTLAVITEQNVELRDGAGRLHATLRTDWPPWDIAFSPDGTLLAEGTTANTADLLAGRSEHNVTVVWNVRDQTVRGAPLDTGDYTPFAVAFSRDGRTLLAVLTRAAAIGPNPGVLAALRTWRAADLAPQSSQIVSDRQVRDLAVRPDGRQLAFADDNRRVVALSADGSRVLWRSPAIPSPIDRIAYSPDGRTLASSGRDGAVRLWNTADGSLIAVLTEQSGMVGGLSFAPDGRTLATATVEGLVGLWQLDPAEAVRRVCRIVVPASRTEGVAPPSACG